MDREQALKIADRILDRVEQDRALHRDAIADEVIAGFTLSQGPTWLGFDWAPDNTEDMSMAGLRRFKRSLFPPPPQTYAEGDRLHGQIASASIMIDWNGPTPPKVKPGDVHWVAASYVQERGWTSDQMFDAGFCYRSTDDAWFS